MDGTKTPGDEIKARLTSKGLSQRDLALILGRYPHEVSNVVNGKLGVSPDLARGLSMALGESPGFWLGLDAERQLSLLPENAAADIARRAQLFELAPVGDMQRRRWIPETDSADALEREVCRFFGIGSVSEEPKLGIFARKKQATAPLTKEQLAWAFRARGIARGVSASPFDPDKVGVLLARLRKLAAFPQEAAKVPRLLADFGIRLVVIEPLSGGSIDGASFWLDERSPVVVLSLRLDRIDAFWFTLCHEIAHIKNRDGWSFDVELVGESASTPIDEAESRANSDAAAMLIDQTELDSFIRRYGPMYSKVQIVQFANRIKMHPGIIVGQMQHRSAVKWGHHRESLVKIRDCLLSTVLVDGWGFSIATL